MASKQWRANSPGKNGGCVLRSPRTLCWREGIGYVQEVVSNGLQGLEVPVLRSFRQSLQYTCTSLLRHVASSTRGRDTARQTPTVVQLCLFTRVTGGASLGQAGILFGPTAVCWDHPNSSTSASLLSAHICCKRCNPHTTTASCFSCGRPGCRTSHIPGCQPAAGRAGAWPPTLFLRRLLLLLSQLRQARQPLGCRLRRVLLCPPAPRASVSPVSTHGQNTQGCPQSVSQSHPGLISLPLNPKHAP